MKYENESDIAAMVEKFERGTISDSEWRHEEHLIAACFYLANNDFETAVSKMRGGIRNLLDSFGADQSKYHETLTVAWMRIVADSIKANNGRDIADLCEYLCVTLDRDVPFRYYSRDLLLSDRARREYVDPDLAPFSGDYL